MMDECVLLAAHSSARCTHPTATDVIIGKLESAKAKRHRLLFLSQQNEGSTRIPRIARSRSGPYEGFARQHIFRSSSVPL